MDGSIDGDVIKQAAAFYLPIVSGVNPYLTEEEKKTVLMMIVSTIQLTFFEADAAKNSLEWIFL